MPGNKFPGYGVSRVQNRPRTEDVERRLDGKEGVERMEHHELRECLGHDDLPRETPFSNLGQILKVNVSDPIRLHGNDPLGVHGGATKDGEYVKDDGN